jgi:CBS domain-containing protein
LIRLYEIRAEFAHAVAGAPAPHEGIANATLLVAIWLGWGCEIGGAHMNAGDVMTTGAATIRPDASLTDAARLMLEHHISGLPVIDAQDQLVGIITEGDFLRPSEGRKPRVLEILASDATMSADALNTHRVDDLMTRNPVTIAVDTSLEQIVGLMTRHNVKRLPVVTQRKVVGIVSRANLMHALLRKVQAAT